MKPARAKATTAASVVPPSRAAGCRAPAPTSSSPIAPAWVINRAKPAATSRVARAASDANERPLLHDVRPRRRGEGELLRVDLVGERRVRELEAVAVALGVQHQHADDRARVL